MQQRFVAKLGSALGRRFGVAPTFSYIKNPHELFEQRATLIPGIFIGPELTRSVLACIEASAAPISFDIIDNFSFDDMSCRERLLKNPYLLVGNLGTPGSQYIENMRCYKALDLSINSNPA